MLLTPEQGPSAFWSIQLRLLAPRGHKCSHCGRIRRLPTCLLLCLSEANRMLVTKTLSHDVTFLVFVLKFSRLSFLVNPASGPRSSGHKHSLCGGRTSPPSLCLMLLTPEQGPSAFWSIQLRLLAPRGHKCSHCGRIRRLPACLLLCLSEANRMLVTKTLSHDVMFLVFVP